MVDQLRVMEIITEPSAVAPDTGINLSELGCHVRILSKL